MRDTVTNIVFAGLGGQGVLKASDILADALLRAGFDVKKSEIHGMSQRGGSVTSDVRFGPQVLSPMVPIGEADFLLVLAPEEVNRTRPYLKPNGVLIAPDTVSPDLSFDLRSLNVVLLGQLSRHLDISEDHWQAAIRANLSKKTDENLAIFQASRTASNNQRSTPNDQRSPGAR